MRSVRHRYTWNEYLALERDANTKHEFFAGEIFAMGGGTPEHSAIAVKIASQLDAQLEGKECRVFNSDLRVRVLATGLGTYPDVTVVCGPLEFAPDAPDTLVNPVVIVEVLSASTEEYDRGAKFDNYRQISSLREYVLVSQRERLVEVHRRQAAGVPWSRVEARIHGVARLESIGCDLTVDRVYAGLSLT